MNDRDPMRERLQRLPLGHEADEVLTGLRPAMRRARTTRRLGAAGITALVALAAVGGVRTLADNGTEVDRIVVTTTPSPDASTPQPSPDPSATPTTQAQPTPTPAPTPSPSPAEPTPPPETSPAPAARPQTFQAGEAGAVTLTVSRDRLVVESVTPTAGWTWFTRRAEPDDVEVQFDREGLRVRLRVRLIDGVAVPEVDTSSSGGSGSGEPDPDEPDDDADDRGGRSDNSGPGNADDREDRDDRDSSGPGSGDD